MSGHSGLTKIHSCLGVTPGPAGDVCEELHTAVMVLMGVVPGKAALVVDLSCLQITFLMFPSCFQAGHYTITHTFLHAYIHALVVLIYLRIFITKFSRLIQ